jgi:hypothetical protein
MKRLEREARALLAESGYEDVEVIRTYPGSILFVFEGKPWTAWKGTEWVTTRTTATGMVQEGRTGLRVEPGFAAVESEYEDAA